MRHSFITITLLLLLYAATASAQSGPQLTHSVVAGGGTTSASGPLQIEGTAGQSVTGVSSGGSFELESGFWAGASVLSPATISGTKTVSGTFNVGNTVTYTVVLSNGGPGAQLDNSGNEFTDVLPASLTLVSASANGGTAVATVGTNTVIWNGTIPSGSSVTITIQANINNGQAGLTITNQGSIAYDADGNGINEATALTDDPGVAGSNDPTGFKVKSAPVADNQSVATDEDTAKAIMLAGSDADNDSLAHIITVNPAHGTLSGTAPNLIYTPAAEYNGTDTFKFKVNDGTFDSAEATVSITVNAVNDAPVNIVPGPQSVIENDSLSLSTAHLNQISISDVDAGANALAVTLVATNGTLTLQGTAGLTFARVAPGNDGTADTMLSFTANITDINAALNGLEFIPTHGYNGTASIQIQTSDNGFTGSVGALIDTDTINITVQDGGTLAFTASTYTVDEAAGTATITVNRTGGSKGEARINYETNDGTAIAGSGNDYMSSTGQLIFADGETSKSFNVTINNDALSEADESITLKLSNIAGSGALGASATAVLTITDNDATPTVSINDVSLLEGNSGTTDLSFTVTLSAASGQQVTVNYATADGTATAPGDYTAIASTLLTFAPGETTKTITVPVNADTANEPSETFFVNLTSPLNATIVDNQGSGTILNDDATQLQMSAATYTVLEAAGHATITVNRTGDVSQPASVDYATSDLSGLNNCDVLTGNASQRCDYTAVAGTLSFIAGQASATFEIPVINDVYVEGPETLTIALSNPLGGALGTPSTATLTINDNDLATGAANPIGDQAFFIRQHYLDFLNREPEGTGLQDWLNSLNNCPATDKSCDLIAVSSGFFRSPEFFDRTYFIYRFYETALGRKPSYDEYQNDIKRVTGFLTNAELATRKQEFIADFVQRQEFRNIYDSKADGADYVNAIVATAGVTPSNSTDVSARQAAHTISRGQALRELLESPEISQRFYNKAFVVVGYFAYLRRDPDALYLDWIMKLNNPPSGQSFEDTYREMIRGFIESIEYRARFGSN